MHKLRQGDLVLIDNGFYSWKLFALLRDACCGVLIRTVMLQAARTRRLPPAPLSFARALTEARVFLPRTAGAARSASSDALAEFVSQCARYVVTVKPGRSFPRDPQEYRTKARGARRTVRGRPANSAQTPREPVEETLTDDKGMTYSLS